MTQQEATLPDTKQPTEKCKSCGGLDVHFQACKDYSLCYGEVKRWDVGVGVYWTCAKCGHTYQAERSRCTVFVKNKKEETMPPEACGGLIVDNRDTTYGICEKCGAHYSMLQAGKRCLVTTKNRQPGESVLGPEIKPLKDKVCDGTVLYNAFSKRMYCEKCHNERPLVPAGHKCGLHIDHPMKTNEGILTHEGKKYLRRIHSAIPDCGSVEVDVYEVLVAFGVTCPAVQHCVKKLLCAGSRDKGSTLADLVGARAALNRAIELQQRREQK